MRAAGVDGADHVQRRGLYPAPPGWQPDTPGLEMAGEVVSVGPRVSRSAPGERVMALVGGGAQATLATVDEAHALAVHADSRRLSSCRDAAGCVLPRRSGKEGAAAIDEKTMRKIIADARGVARSGGALSAPRLGKRIPVAHRIG